MTLLKHFPIGVSKSTQEQFERMLSNWIYNRNLPFNIFENDFQEIISFVIPGLIVPGYKIIGGRLLDEQYERINFLLV